MGRFFPLTTHRWVGPCAVTLILSGALLIFLQLEILPKLLRGLLAYVGWMSGGSNDSPPASEAPTPLDIPLQELYSLLTLRQPLLPWLLWVAGALLLLLARQPTPVAALSLEPSISPDSAPAGRATDKRWSSLPLLRSLALLVAAITIGAWLRAAHLLPLDGEWPASNFDEMVYYTQAELWTQGAWPYRDTFMAHPPGVLWAFAPALLSEQPWGGAAAFIAARQWLFLYSIAALPLIWLCGRKLGGPLSGALAALVLALDGKAAFAPQSDGKLPNVGILETLANATSLGGLALYLYAPQQVARRRWWLFGAGAVLGASALCKLPGVALLLALLLYSLATRRAREALWLASGGLAGAALLTLPFFVTAPGQMLRQSLFFQLLRPQEVRAGVDQISRIAAYPEAQVTLLLAGLGLAVISLLLALRLRQLRQREKDAHFARALWVLPALWAAPLAAVFILGRSFHSQYYTQWVPPLALLSGALVSRQFWQLWRGASPRRMAASLSLAALLSAALLPLLMSQWRVASLLAYDTVYKPTGEVLRQGISHRGLQERQGRQTQVMAFDPGYTFAAGLPPARIPPNGPYLVDTAGYTVYIAREIDRMPFRDLLKSALQFNREQNEANLLKEPGAQAALLAGTLGAGAVVLDQKIALPKLSPQSVRLLEGLAEKRDDIAFATVLWARLPSALTNTPFSGVHLNLEAIYLARLGQEDTPLVGAGTLQATSGDVVQLGLYWRPEDYPGRNYHMVARIVDKNGDTALQMDAEPSQGADHTLAWRPGLVYPDIRNIPLSNLPPGAYNLFVRVYDPITQATSHDMPLAVALEVR